MTTRSARASVGFGGLTACALLACGGPMFAGSYEGQSGITGTCTVNGRVENLPSQTIATQLTLTESGSLVRFGACGGEATASARISGNVAQLEPFTCPPRVTTSGATQTLVLTGGNADAERDGARDRVQLPTRRSLVVGHRDVHRHAAGHARSALSG